MHVKTTFKGVSLALMAFVSTNPVLPVFPSASSLPVAPSEQCLSDSRFCPGIGCFPPELECPLSIDFKRDQDVQCTGNTRLCTFYGPICVNKDLSCPHRPLNAPVQVADVSERSAELACEGNTRLCTEFGPICVWNGVACPKKAFSKRASSDDGCPGSAQRWCPEFGGFCLAKIVPCPLEKRDINPNPGHIGVPVIGNRAIVKCPYWETPCDSGCCPITCASDQVLCDGKCVDTTLGCPQGVTV